AVQGEAEGVERAVRTRPAVHNGEPHGRRSVMARVGFVFECGRGGADTQVCIHFLGRLNPDIQPVSRFMDHKKRLVEECGPVAAELLQTCERVIIVWDLFPLWRPAGKPCRHADRQSIFASLAAHKVPIERVSLVCIREELEAWLLADRRAVEAVVGARKRPHNVQKFTAPKKPDATADPKTRLTRYFVEELGPGRKSSAAVDAIRIAKAIPDWTKLKRSDSFRRFAEKAAGVIV
ncbi:MAG: hypothetical protein U1D97_09100, partial [Desulfuromonadales bacterium]|nr:hypothetical protein [Desulfuromonadales bacterium]